MVAHPSPRDPLLRYVALTHSVDLPVMGVPVRFRSNSEAVLAAVHQSFGRWAAQPATAAPEAEIRIVVQAGTERERERTPVTVRMPDDDRLLWHTSGSVGALDLSRGNAVAYVTAPLVDDAEHFRNTVLEGMTLVLVAARDRQPVHASLIARHGRAVLLCGPTGRGKSTLAYAALRAGWQVLADDGVYVQTNPRMALWGRPSQILLPGEARDHFPELAAREPTRQASGKLKIPVDTGVTTQPDPFPEAAVCVLARGDTAALERLDHEELAELLTREPEPGLELYGDRPARVARMLAARGGWRLVLSDDPDDAVTLLGRLATG